mmetsp:Transcript_12879/g.30662  ORF Transcript_12879/g.30662 Transcript_12879/m.30662 type:complete len:220 (+) Transcript_12879:376-1035(+)
MLLAFEELGLGDRFGAGCDVGGDFGGNWLAPHGRAALLLFELPLQLLWHVVFWGSCSSSCSWRAHVRAGRRLPLRLPLPVIVVVRLRRFIPLRPPPVRQVQLLLRRLALVAGCGVGVRVRYRGSSGVVRSCNRRLVLRVTFSGVSHVIPRVLSARSLGLMLLLLLLALLLQLLVEQGVRQPCRVLLLLLQGLLIRVVICSGSRHRVFRLPEGVFRSRKE